jgi:hypothetical protein
VKWGFISSTLKNHPGGFSGYFTPATTTFHQTPWLGRLAIPIPAELYTKLYDRHIHNFADYDQASPAVRASLTPHYRDQLWQVRTLLQTLLPPEIMTPQTALPADTLTPAEIQLVTGMSHQNPLKFITGADGSLSDVQMAGGYGFFDAQTHRALQIPDNPPKQALLRCPIFGWRSSTTAEAGAAHRLALMLSALGTTPVEHQQDSQAYLKTLDHTPTPLTNSLYGTAFKYLQPAATWVKGHQDTDVEHIITAVDQLAGETLPPQLLDIHWVSRFSPSSLPLHRGMPQYRPVLWTTTPPSELPITHPTQPRSVIAPPAPWWQLACSPTDQHGFVVSPTSLHPRAGGIKTGLRRSRWTALPKSYLQNLWLPAIRYGPPKDPSQPWVSIITQTYSDLQGPLPLFPPPLVCSRAALGRLFDIAQASMAAADLRHTTYWPALPSMQNPALTTTRSGTDCYVLQSVPIVTEHYHLPPHVLPPVDIQLWLFGGWGALLHLDGLMLPCPWCPGTQLFTLHHVLHEPCTHPRVRSFQTLIKTHHWKALDHLPSLFSHPCRAENLQKIRFPTPWGGGGPTAPHPCPREHCIGLLTGYQLPRKRPSGWRRERAFLVMEVHTHLQTMHSEFTAIKNTTRVLAPRNLPTTQCLHPNQNGTLCQKLRKKNCSTCARHDASQQVLSQPKRPRVLFGPHLQPPPNDMRVVAKDTLALLYLPSPNTNPDPEDTHPHQDHHELEPEPMIGDMEALAALLTPPPSSPASTNDKVFQKRPTMERDGQPSAPSASLSASINGALPSASNEDDDPRPLNWSRNFPSGSHLSPGEAAPHSERAARSMPSPHLVALRLPPPTLAQQQSWSHRQKRNRLARRSTTPPTALQSPSPPEPPSSRRLKKKTRSSGLVSARIRNWLSTRCQPQPDCLSPAAPSISPAPQAAPPMTQLGVHVNTPYTPPSWDLDPWPHPPSSAATSHSSPSTLKRPRTPPGFLAGPDITTKRPRLNPPIKVATHLIKLGKGRPQVT